MGAWVESEFLGPEGQDWRVPVSELEHRIELLSKALQEEKIPGVFIQHPVDLYYFSGGRQNATLFVPASGSKATAENGGAGPVLLVRRSLSRAKYEAGGDNSPFEILPFPRMKILVEF